MCKKRNGRRVDVGDRIVRVDSCMANVVALINTVSGFRTLACCCGHGRYDQSIIVRDRRGTVFDLVSNQIIRRKRKFYKLDGKGYYYIPEVVEGL